MTTLVNNLHQADFTTPAKIFDNQHAIHHFENITPGVSMPITPSLSSKDDDSLPPTAIHTPPTSSNSSVSSSKEALHYNATKTSLDTKGFPSPPPSMKQSKSDTPSQFIFKKPEYNKRYHHTHFHHKLEKKDTIFKDLKKLFKSDKKKAKKNIMKSSNSSLTDLSFANKFNKDLEGKYGKWGKVYFTHYLRVQY
jgi:hypothetical protein